MRSGRRCRSPTSLRRDGVASEAGEIERFCLAQLARYKVPREYVFVASLPRNAMGKVQHFRLREQLAAEQDGSAAAPTTEQAPEADRGFGRWQWFARRGR